MTTKSLFLILAIFTFLCFGCAKTNGEKNYFLKEEPFYVGKYQVVPLQYYELKGPMAKRYHFIIMEKIDRLHRVISLGSYGGTNKVLQEIGKLEKGQRRFHLDGYDGKQHYTFSFMDGEPIYQDVKKMVIEILKENNFQKTSISSSEFSGGLLP